MLISEGVPAEKLVVTGSSKFDDLISFKEPGVKEQLKEKYGIPAEKKVVLVLTSWFVEAGIWTAEDRSFFVTEIAKVCDDLKDVQLVFKLHAPHENKKDYLELLKNYTSESLIFDTEPLHEIICISDVVVSVSSTAALEAMALDKPVMIVNMDNGSKIFKDSGALFIEKTDSFESALVKLIYYSNEVVDLDKIREFVYNQAYKIDGNASRRIGDLIKSMIN